MMDNGCRYPDSRVERGKRLSAGVNGTRGWQPAFWLSPDFLTARPLHPGGYVELRAMRRKKDVAPDAAGLTAG